MARGRMLNRSVGVSGKVARMVDNAGPWAAVLHHRLIAFLDKNGNCRADPWWLKAELFPRDDGIQPAHCLDMAAALVEHDLAVPYEVNGMRYLHFPGFREEQPGLRPEKEKAEVPVPDGFDEESGTWPAHRRPTVGKKPGNSPSEVEVEVEVEVEESPNGLGASSDAPPPIKKRFPATPPKHGTEYAYPAEFEDAWNAYPKRDGGNPKMGAYKAWRARVVRGEPPDNLLAASEHYATHCAVKEMEGTSFVQQTATFYGPSEPYQEFVESPGLNGHTSRAPPRPLTAEEKAQYRELRASLEASGMGPERAAEKAMEQVRGSL